MERHLIQNFDDKITIPINPGKIGIKISYSFASTRNGQILLWTLCNLTCRLKGLVNEITIILPKNIEYIYPNYISYNESKSKKLKEVFLENINKTKRDINIIFREDDFSDELDVIILVGSDCSTKAKCNFIKKVMAVKWLSFIGDKENFKEILINNDQNPFGSLVAGCLGVGEIFKYLLRMKGETGSYLTNYCLSSYDFLEYHKTNYDSIFLENNNPRFPDHIELEELVIVGSGAVGHSFSQSIYSIEKISGEITVIDREVDDYGKSEKIESTNLARYILANNNDLGKSKASLLAERLDTKKGFCIDFSNESFQEWANNHDEKICHIISCVDNNKVRHDIQEKLPKNIHGGSNQDLRSQISTYDLSKNIQCLKCYNLKKLKFSDDDKLKKLTEMKPSERMNQCKILKLNYEKIIAMISNPSCDKLDTDILKRFEGLWLKSDFSVNFVSTLSGVLLASEIIKINVDGFKPKLNCKPYSDLYFSFWHGTSHLSITQSEPKCWCNFGKITPRMIHKKNWTDK